MGLILHKRSEGDFLSIVLYCYTFVIVLIWVSVSNGLDLKLLMVCLWSRCPLLVGCGITPSSSTTTTSSSSSSSIPAVIELQGGAAPYRPDHILPSVFAKESPVVEYFSSSMSDAGLRFHLKF